MPHQPSQTEKRLFSRLKLEAGDTHTMVPIARIASDEYPLHKEEAVNLIKRWENEGLVETFRGGTNARLTESGMYETL